MTATATDIHTHIVPGEVPPYAGSCGEKRWPQMAAGSDCHHRNVMIDGNLFRTVDDRSWDVDRRLDAMTACGIARQVLSPMPELLSYWFAPEDAVAFGRHVNETIAQMVDRAPERFAGLGMVPLQDPDLAARELESLMATGRFRGVEIGTNVNGVPIGDARFDPFWAAAEQLGASVFVHALHPTGAERLIGPKSLMALVGFPCETSFAIVSLITGGTLGRFPRLRLAFSHGGGVFGLVLPRLMQGWGMMPKLAEQAGGTPVELARKLFYDTLVYDAPTLRFLLDRFGETQLCIGTDFPFTIEEKDPVGAIDAIGPDARLRALLMGENAERFLTGSR
ncbi:MAG: amidohydrolase family protein [Sneathiellaceae bacterium]